MNYEKQRGRSGRTECRQRRGACAEALRGYTPASPFNNLAGYVDESGSASGSSPAFPKFERGPLCTLLMPSAGDCSIERYISRLTHVRVHAPPGLRRFVPEKGANGGGLAALRQLVFTNVMLQAFDLFIQFLLM